MSKVHIPYQGTLMEFVDLFGDDILDEALNFDFTNPVDGIEALEYQHFARWDRSETTTAEILETASKFEQEILSTFISDIGNTHKTAHKTQVYMQGILDAVATGESDLSEAGMRTWRWAKSKHGAIAYEYALKAAPANLGWGEIIKRAWRAFYNTSRVVEIKRTGLVLEKVNGDIQEVNWGLAKWKLDQKEIAFKPGDRERLKNILRQRGWGYKLMKHL